MKRTAAFLALLLTSTLALTPVFAEPRDYNGFSLGMELGDPTGLTLRAGIGEAAAIQAALGFSPFPGDALVGLVDWTYDVWDFLPDNVDTSMMFYFGVGGKVEWLTGHYYIWHNNHSSDLGSGDYFGLGVRGLLGLRFPFREAPFDLFIELAPAGFLFVLPDSGVFYDIDFSLGVRYRF